jgi:hypothetical protein
MGVEIASPHTLKEILNAKHLPIADAKLTNLDKNTTSGAELDDANQFVIAYYVDDGKGLLQPPLYLDRYDKRRGEWKSAVLSDTEEGAGAVDTVCFGSVLSIQAAGNRLSLDTHINPSAGCLLVLSPEFKLEASLSGWLLGRLGEDKLIYERSEVHFSPVHPVEIAVYDLKKNQDLTLFPPKGGSAIRQARTVQLAEFYKANPEWCNKNNDPCDPENFDSALDGQVATNEVGSAVAFLISYEQIQFAQGDLQKPSGPKSVLYVYRRVGDETKVEYREILLDEVTKQFGKVSLPNLLQPDLIEKVFGDFPSKRP